MNDPLIIECVLHELDSLYKEFEKYGGAANMRPVNKYDTWRLVEYQKIMRVREKWSALAIKLFDCSKIDNLLPPADAKNKIWEQAIKLDCENIADLIYPSRDVCA